ncbi:MAG: phage holin family protein [Thermomicrobiales bacterium]
MIRLLAYIVAGMASVLILGTVFGDRMVEYDSEVAVLVFGAALGLLVFFIKPIVTLISLPITCLTFGLFALVINGAFFGLAAFVVPGVDVTWLGAVVGGVISSVLSGIIYSVFDEESRPADQR